ncbi:MAG: GDYXXLXY domain-containing protein [Acidimicrobiia bacterium]|nr:GDYXXLXY domain-containing protein [Acidimicrobiia bacterium]
MTRAPIRLFAVILAIQALILVGMSIGRETTLLRDDTVILQTVPVDPRDLLRGDFVVLRYEISSLSVSQANPGDTVFVELVEDSDGQWVAAGADTSINPDWDRFIRGTQIREGTIEYGIEAYFVPEGRGLEIERAQDVDVVVALDEGGNAVIKEIIVDGNVWD